VGVVLVPDVPDAKRYQMRAVDLAIKESKS
jgi:hypothetical protein